MVSGNRFKQEKRITIREIDGKPWVDLSATWPMDLPAYPETHSLKIGKLETNRIPCPPQMIGLHIDKAEKPSLFGWAAPDIVKMNRKSLPPLMVMHIQSRALDRDELGSQTFAYGEARYRATPKTYSFRHIQKLAEHWTEGLPRGWAQISAIERKLRENYVLDPAYRPDENCICPVGEFLFCSKRGPDYQFATAAAVMLRSLGYSARVVSGFYADPEEYDPRSRHTSVFSDDVHFWAEVSLDPNTWVTIEATPGFKILTPPPTFWDRVADGLKTIGAFLVRHAAIFVFSVLLLMATYWRRLWLLDQMETAWCLGVVAKNSPNRLAVLTLQVLDRRCKRVGLVRPAGMTPSRWLTELSSLNRSVPQPTWSLVVQIVEETMFNPGNPPPNLIAAPRMHQACRLMLGAWSWRTLKSLRRERKL